HQQPDRETDRGAPSQTGEQPERQKRDPEADRDRGDQPGDLLHLPLQRAVLPLDPRGQRRDPAEFGVHSGRGDHGASPPPVRTVPLNTTSRASSSGPTTSGASAERETGADSPVSMDRSTSRAPAIR